MEELQKHRGMPMHGIFQDLAPGDSKKCQQSRNQGEANAKIKLTLRRALSAALGSLASSDDGKPWKVIKETEEEDPADSGIPEQGIIFLFLSFLFEGGGSRNY